MMTRLAPAVRCAAAFSLDVKMPVHSSAMSMPSSFHGSVAGSLMAVTLIMPLPTLMESPTTLTSRGKRPCTESNRNRCALVSTGARSLMATTSMASRSASAMARSTLRPIRPNPLMATRTDIPDSFTPLYRPLSLAECTLIDSRVPAAALSPPQLGERGLGDFLRRDPEMLVEVLGRRARAERGHADKGAVRADDLVPSLPHRGLDRDLDLGGADDFLPLGCRQSAEELE